MPESGLTSEGHRIHIYVSKQQYEEIEDCVGSDGVTVAGFCRDAFEQYLTNKRKEMRQQKLAETCRKLIEVDGQKSFKCGDVVLVKLNQQALIKKNGAGAGLRAVVVSCDALNKNLETVIVCPLIEREPILESVTGATFVPKEVVGLNTDGVVLCLQIITVSREQVVEQIGVLPPFLLSSIRRGLKTVLDLD